MRRLLAANPFVSTKRPCLRDASCVAMELSVDLQLDSALPAAAPLPRPMPSALAGAPAAARRNCRGEERLRLEGVS